ncbi:MAG TPA: Na+/H+ antiporter subunit E [Burkholderiales bacterium]
MRRWLPYPLVSAALAALWLALNESAAPLHLLAAALAGVLGGRVLARLEPPHGRMQRRLRAGAELVWLVLVDIVQSNIAVARIVLSPPARRRPSGFIDLALDARHPAALAALAIIVTATPGTSWARYDAARNVVSIHMLDLDDGQAWARAFKARYERRLLEIFP